MSSDLSVCPSPLMAMMGLHNEFSDLEVVWFTEGDCWFLALHLAQRLNTSVAVLSPIPRDWSGEMWELDWFHVAVDLGEVDGVTLYADITGVHTASELMGAWDDMYRMMCDDENAYRGVARVAVSDFLQGGLEISYPSVAEVVSDDAVVFDHKYDINDVCTRLQELVYLELAEHATACCA